MNRIYTSTNGLTVYRIVAIDARNKSYLLEKYYWREAVGYQRDVNPRLRMFEQSQVNAWIKSEWWTLICVNNFLPPVDPSETAGWNEPFFL